ncbi:uncharacterized protein LOC126789083 [Argentina anserina]|uniref:uncharacterized protein LOC126789083 n=1 Tax=Argentina anserina TaxID=57926 RepID=UPI00217655A2|nr:uncharacterized protein LOC126789083 [Potentilla anserina]
MTTTRTRGVYLSVIKDVINKVRPQFVNGPGENILMQLQANWETKVMQAGVVGAPAVDLNVLVFPRSPPQPPVQPQRQQPLPGTGNPTGMSHMQPPYLGTTSQTRQTAGGGLIPGLSGGSSSNTSVKVEGVKVEGGVKPPWNIDVEPLLNYEDIDPSLNEDDGDEDLDDVEEGEEELNTQNLVLAQFE